MSAIQAALHGLLLIREATRAGTRVREIAERSIAKAFRDCDLSALASELRDAVVAEQEAHAALLGTMREVRLEREAAGVGPLSSLGDDRNKAALDAIEVAQANVARVACETMLDAETRKRARKGCV